MQRILCQRLVLAWASSLFLWSMTLPTVVSAASPTDVLIYYANEASPNEQEAENYRVMIEWLESSGLEKGLKIAHGFKNEAPLFGGAVATEQKAMEEGALRCQPPLPVMVFTNRLAQQGTYRVFRPGRDEAFVTLPIQKIESDNYIITSNPLSQAVILDRALSAAATQFDPKQHRFVLITKSHGGKDLALTVRLARRHEEISREQLIEGLQNPTATVAPAVVGTSKEEYFDCLQKAGEQYGMQFSLVFVEACQGTFELPMIQKLPQNVTLLYSSGDRFLQYQTLNYPELFSRVSKTRSFSAVLDDELKPKYLALYRAPNTPSYWSWLGFGAVGIWLLWMVVRWRRSGTTATAPQS
ncbi:MAG: hypothetical protein SGJ20_16820 [Planctomycetota bacterium]|nr:hypothetical protein [Planctomycetota bacterium]